VFLTIELRFVSKDNCMFVVFLINPDYIVILDEIDVFKNGKVA